MTGIATKFSALEVLKKTLLTSGDTELIEYGEIIERNSGYAHFGSLCDSYGDFSPVRIANTGILGSPGANPYVSTWKLIFDVFGGDGSPSNPGLKQLLDRIRNLINRLDDITAREDLDDLKAMEDQVDEIGNISEELTAVIVRIKGDGTLQNLGLVPLFQEYISGINRPAIIKERVDGSGYGFPESFWTLREFLSWKRTGEFAEKLWTKAKESGSQELMAYALGWISSWSLNAGGGTAIASIVGAPYRNDWWRTRFVSNYVDLWAHGFYQTSASMNGDIPNPGYDDWPNLCDQELQSKIELPGVSFDPDEVMEKLRLLEALPTQLPGFFIEYWVNAYDEVYGDYGGIRPEVNADTLQDAYAMAWLVLWFQTSKESLGCHAKMPDISGFCGEPPAWTDPSNPNDADGDGQPDGLPAPSVNPVIDEGTLGCGIFLIVLGALLIIGGGYVAGGAAIVAGIETAKSSGNIDWEEFKCDLAWYKVYLYNALRALHDLLSLGAFVHPYTHELSNDSTIIELLRDFNYDIRTGTKIVKTKTSKEAYPLEPWNGNSFWFDTPSRGLEYPLTEPALASAYPSGFINDPTNPLGSQSTFTPITWPFNRNAEGNALGYKNSVESVVGWLQNKTGNGIPAVNLDGDRGMTFGEWNFGIGGWTNPVNIIEP